MPLLRLWSSHFRELDIDVALQMLLVEVPHLVDGLVAYPAVLVVLAGVHKRTVRSKYKLTVMLLFCFLTLFTAANM